MPPLVKVRVPEPTKLMFPTPVADEVSVIVPAVRVKFPVTFNVPLPAPLPEDKNNEPPDAFILKCLVTFTVVVPVVFVFEPVPSVESKMKSLPIFTVVLPPVVPKITLDVPSTLKSVPIFMVGFCVVDKLILPDPVLMILNSPATLVRRPAKSKTLAALNKVQLK